MRMRRDVCAWRQRHPGLPLLLLCALSEMASSMEPFVPRPFHKTGRTRDEVSHLRKQYERMPHERRMSAGKKYSGDEGVIDPSVIKSHEEAHTHDDTENNRYHDPQHGPERSKFNQALKDFKSSFGAHEQYGDMPVWAFQKPFKDKWNDKKMTKLIQSAPEGKKGYFETVHILQKAGVELGEVHVDRGGKAFQKGKHPDLHSETAIDLDKIPEHKRGFFKNQEKQANNPGKLERWATLNKKAENKGWKTVRGELTKTTRDGKAVPLEKVPHHRRSPGRKLLAF